jgi:hypothetical protein
MDAIERRVAATELKLTDEFRAELRRALQGELEQNRQLFDLYGKVSALASRVGHDAGELSGREAARDATKHTGAKATLAAMVIAAVTSGVVQGLYEAFKPRPAPAPTHQLPP